MANEKRLIDANKLTERIASRLRNDAIIKWLCGIIADEPTVDAVVLPCKIGDTLYDIYEPLSNGEGITNEYHVKEICIRIDKRGRQFLVIGNNLIPFDDFGKTVFPTREEAEAALAKMDGDGNGT